MKRGTPSGLGSTLVVGLVLVLIGACVDLRPSPAATPRGTTGQPSTVPSGGPPTALTSATATASSTPASSPTPTSEPAPPIGSGPPATPGPTIDPALAAQIDEVISQVPAIRELGALSDVPYEFITREQFRDDLIELQFEEVPEETFRAEERLLKRLGLVPDDADLLQLLVDLYGGQVAAFYRPDSKRFYIIARDEPFGPADKIIVAHEYTHALQDQHFDLEGTRITDLSEGDAVLGQLAAIEGDATLTMQLWAQNNLSPEELLEVLFGSIGQLGDPTLANMPPILRRQLEFPYAEGFTFVQDVYSSGGFAAVNQTLQDAPESTEQILHPEKYHADEQPVEVQLADATDGLGDGWVNAYEQTIGELLTQVWAAGDEAPEVMIPGFPVEWPHAEVAAGWGGDQLAMFEHTDGRWAIAWRLAWDTQDDADEFIGRAVALGSTFGGPIVVSGTDQQFTMTLIVASDQQTLSDISAENGIEPPY